MEENVKVRASAAKRGVLAGERLLGRSPTRVSVTDGGLVARILALYNAAVDQYGDQFGERERRHAADNGDWVVDDRHALDIGQDAIRLWWD